MWMGEEVEGIITADLLSAVACNRSRSQCNMLSFFSNDNRRLYVFRVLNLLGILKEIEVEVGKKLHRQKYTTENDGCHVFVRGSSNNNRGGFDETYLHCTCEEQKNCKSLPGELWFISFLFRLFLTALTKLKKLIKYIKTKEKYFEIENIRKA